MQPPRREKFKELTYPLSDGFVINMNDKLSEVFTEGDVMRVRDYDAWKKHEVV